MQISRISNEVAKSLAPTLDPELPQKVDYILSTSGIGARIKDHYGDANVLLSIASFLVSTVGVGVQIFEAMRKKHDQVRHEDLERELRAASEKPSILPQRHFEQIVSAITEQVVREGSGESPSEDSRSQGKS